MRCAQPVWLYVSSVTSLPIRYPYKPLILRCPSTEGQLRPVKTDRLSLIEGLGCSSDPGVCRHRMQPTEACCLSLADWLQMLKLSQVD
jgi:hypothetical protein